MAECAFAGCRDQIPKGLRRYCKTHSEMKRAKHCPNPRLTRTGSNYFDFTCSVCALKSRLPMRRIKRTRCGECEREHRRQDKINRRTEERARQRAREAAGIPGQARPMRRGCQTCYGLGDRRPLTGCPECDQPHMVRVGAGAWARPEQQVAS